MTAIATHRDGDVFEILLDRPAKKNALRDEDWVALRAAAEAVPDAARCVVLRGAGGDFSAGWDLGQSEAGAVDVRAVIREFVNPALRAVRTIPVPTVAAVDGACLGGGLGIAAACDIIIASETAKLGSPFRRIGIMLDAGGHHVLRDRLGHHKASELIYTGRFIDGREAHALGLVCQLHPDDRMLAEARAMAAHIAAGPTAAFRASKRILLAHPGYDDALDLEADGQGEIFATRDAAEGLSAFLAKREPKFEGR